MIRNKRISNKDLFYFYPYKKNIITTGNTVPQPYVKKSDEVVDHPLSIDYNVWQSVINSYINIITETLLTGREYYFPTYMGKLQLRKYRTNRRINWKATQDNDKKTYYSLNTNTVILKWYRDYRITRLKRRFHWKVGMAKILKTKIYERLSQNKNYIFNILDT